MVLKLTLELIWNPKENKVSCDLTHLGIEDRGYYMVTRGSECYVLVARTISHEWVQQMSEILFLPRKYNIFIFGPMCNVLLVIKTYLWRRFWQFSDHFLKISKDFLKLFWRPDERSRTFPELFWRFSEDNWRLPKETKGDPRMFRSHKDNRRLPKKTKGDPRMFWSHRQILA